jgi:hypothetical protein
MTKKKSNKIDLGQGFKRIYYVLTAIYFFFIVAQYIDYYDKCSPHPGYTKYDYPIYCSDITLMSELRDIAIIILIPIAIYYFLKWIILGFKKK